ncbi:MAG: response regulator transcription factor [Lachnospiraceae bacterium]|nr:response regulator transcription factor [Lachnospiraceae bacterium]
MRIALCDDERQTSEKLYDMIENISRSLDVITDVFTDGNELLRRFAQKSYDLVFLDIEMPAVDGLTVAEKLRDMSTEVFIVFLTSHVEYAIKGYEVNALRYLTKPPAKEKVREIIEYVRKKQAEEKSLWIKTGDGEYKLKLSDIIYIEALNQKMLIHTLSGNYEVWGKLSDYEDKLGGEGFFRIHRSFLVSLSKVCGIKGQYIKVSGGDELPVGRTKEQSFRTAMIAYADREAF